MKPSRQPQVVSPTIVARFCVCIAAEKASLALALSLASEFLARGSLQAKERFRSLALVSPTGMDRLNPSSAQPGSTRAVPGGGCGACSRPRKR